MSKVTDNLDALSNDELRLQMLQFGLPKMPVTDTTRNVLIKKLRRHINESKDKTRRETIHVIKYSSDEESEADSTKVKKSAAINRRVTIGVPASTTQPLQPPASVAVKSTRRSGRVTPTNNIIITTTNQPEYKSIYPKLPNVPDIIEDTDEEVIDYPQRPLPPIDRRSKSKSPSLSKSDVVTTSYKHVVAPLLEEDEEPLPLPPKPIEHERILYPEKKPSRTTISTIYEDKDIRRVSPFNNRGVDSPRHSTIGNYKYGESTSFSRPSISTSYNSYSSYSDRDWNAGRYKTDITAAPMDVDPAETPYLSDFTRRLSQLKAEPLEKGSAKRESLLRETGYYRTDGKRRPIKKNDESVFESFKKFLAVLEMRYKLKRNLLIIFVVLFIIFIIVFFWQ